METPDGVQAAIYIGTNHAITLYTDNTNPRKKVFYNRSNVVVEIPLGGYIVNAAYDIYTRYRERTSALIATIRSDQTLAIYYGGSDTFIDGGELISESLDPEVYTGLRDMYFDNWSVYILYDDYNGDLKIIKYNVDRYITMWKDVDFELDMSNIDFDDIRIYSDILYMRQGPKLKYHFVYDQNHIREVDIFYFNDPIHDWVIVEGSIGVLTVNSTSTMLHVLNIDTLSGLSLIDPSSLSVDDRQTLSSQKLLYRGTDTIITSITRGYLFNSAINTNIKIRLVQYTLYNPDGSHTGEVFSDNYITIPLVGDVDKSVPLESLFDQLLFSATPASSNVEFLTFWSSYRYVGQLNDINDTLANTYMIEISFTEDVELIIEEY